MTGPADVEKTCDSAAARAEGGSATRKEKAKKKSRNVFIVDLAWIAILLKNVRPLQFLENYVRFCQPTLMP